MKTTIVTFNLDEFSEIISGVKSYCESESYNVILATNLEDVHKALDENEANILIFSIQSKEKFQGLVGVFKAKLKEIKSGRLKLAYAQKTKNPKVESILNKFLCNDFLDQKLLTKSLNYKVEIWSRNVLANAKKISDLKNKEKPLKQKTLQDKNRRSHNINKLDPLEGKFDIWLSPKNNCKAILAKWLVTFYGPSPNIAKWESEKVGVWKFVIDSEYEKQFLQEKGIWYFEGLKPEFNWKDKMWSFTSSSFNLYFVDTDKATHNKSKSNFTDLDIKSNSDYANSLLQKIVDSTKSNNVQASEKQKNVDGTKKELKGSQLKKEYLEADSKTDKINSHMSGDVKSEEDSGGNYSGKLKEHSTSEPSGMSFKDKGAVDKDLSGKGSKADSFSNLSGSIDNSSTESKNKKKSENKKNEDIKEDSHGKNDKPVETSDNTESINHSSQDEATKEKKEATNGKFAEKSKDRILDKGTNPNKEDQKSEMLDAMVNPSKNAVRLTHGSVAYLCDLVDLFEEELYVTLKGNELKKEVKYSVVITMDMGKSKVSITTEGTVDSLDGDIYKILVNEIPSSEYEKFMTSFEERQDDINDFIQRARGF